MLDIGNLWSIYSIHSGVVSSFRALANHSIGIPYDSIISAYLSLVEMNDCLEVYESQYVAECGWDLTFVGRCRRYELGQSPSMGISVICD